MIFYIHGGGYVSGTIEDFDPFTRGLCSRTQAIVIGVEYKLAPEFKYPVQEQQCLNVLKWVFSEPESSIKIFSKNFVANLEMYLVGDSAGANMAANLAMKYADDFRFSG